MECGGGVSGTPLTRRAGAKCSSGEINNRHEKAVVGPCMMVRVADNNTRHTRPLAGRGDFEEAPNAHQELLLVLGFAFSGRFLIELFADDSQFHLTVCHHD